MSTATMDRLRKELHDVLVPARDIAEAAEKENRDLTAEERAKVQKAVEDAAPIKAKITQAKADGALSDQLRELGDGIGLLPESAKARTGIDFAGNDLWVPRKGETLGSAFAKSKQLGDLLKRFPNGNIPKQAHIASEPFSAKALITGVSDSSAGALVQNDNIGIQVGLDAFQRPLTMRQIVTNGTTTSDAVEYVRIVSTTNNAAPVAEATSSAGRTAPGSAGALLPAAGGGYKPESAMTLQKVTTNVKTIAHWLPATSRALSDAGQLRTLIDAFLLYGLEEELEDQITNGNGVGENFEGIATVSGTQDQAWSATVAGVDPLLETTLKARTKVRTGGRSIPTAYVFNPLDWERIHLARLAKNPNNEAVAGATPTLHGLRVVESEAITAGTGWCGAWYKAVLWDRQQAAVTVSNSHDDFFIRNLVAILAEGRYAFGVLQPSAFVEIDLTE